MLVKTAAGREWSATPYEGIEQALFRNKDEGGRASMVRLKCGARPPRHAHRGSEELVVLADSVRIGEVHWLVDDDLFTQADEEHDLAALTDAVIFLSSQRATPVVET